MHRLVDVPGMVENGKGLLKATLKRGIKNSKRVSLYSTCPVTSSFWTRWTGGSTIDAANQTQDRQMHKYSFHAQPRPDRVCCAIVVFVFRVVWVWSWAAVF